jgi:two-component system OmpR family sensor kinase
VALETKTLYAKLAGALLVLFLVVGGVTLAVTLLTSYFYEREVQQRIHRDLADHIVAEELLIVDGQIAEDALKNVFHMMMVINPSIELYLLDPAGEILAFSAPPGRVKLSRVEMGPVEVFLKGDARLPILGDDPRHPERRNIFSVSPILREGTLEGYLYIVLESERFVSVADMLRGSYILRSGVWAVVGSVVVTLLGALLLSRHLTRRLTGLNRDLTSFRAAAMETAAADGRSADSGVEAKQDEIDQLRSSFDAMAVRIKEQIAQLEEQDRLRREMVANVSHDLRTPLTHLQGYLETLMLKEESLAPEERREYLEIAVQHGERLGRLVSDLFELAKLEALHEPLERERLPAGELVQDVAQKYRLQARDRGVLLNADFEGGRLWISADVGLIERALENVLDNALRYTPEGGRIDINLRPHDDRLSIEVQDTGPGIAEGDLPQIFDRFYRAHRPEEEVGEGRGAGLGLAIAKRAVELHGGHLNCESGVGEGTTFRFDLPVVESPGGIPAPVS